MRNGVRIFARPLPMNKARKQDSPWRVIMGLTVLAASLLGVSQSSALRPRGADSSSVYWGAYIEGAQTYRHLYGGHWGDAPWDARTLAKFEHGAAKRVAVEHYGQPPPWEQSFDAPTASLVESRGDIPAIDMSTQNVPLRAITAGSYDASIASWALAAKAWGHPFFLLFDEEMNGTWYPYSPGRNGNTAADFVAMWRHVHDIFTVVGATNVTWVWCPNVDPDHVFTPYSELYPGDAYVDWTGLNGYNWGGREWTSFAKVFGSSYKALLQVAPTKPIMVGETASAEGGGSKAAWITRAFSTDLPKNFPRVKAVLWFNWRIHEKGAWWPWEIESSATAQRAFAAAIKSSYYAAGGRFANLPLLTKVQPLR